MTSISYALSGPARSYLESGFECTTREHLLGMGVAKGDNGLNVFEENVRLKLGENTDLDQEIAEYLQAVAENREPYDPAEHEFDVRQSDSGGWEIWMCGTATGGEWESIDVKPPKPSLSECYFLFNQFVRQPES